LTLEASPPSLVVCPATGSRWGWIRVTGLHTLNVPRVHELRGGATLIGPLPSPFKVLSLHGGLLP